MDFGDAAADELPAAASHFYVTRASVGWLSGPKSAVRPRAAHHVAVNLVVAEPGWWNYVQADMQELLIKQARPRRPPHGSVRHGWKFSLSCVVGRNLNTCQVEVFGSFGYFRIFHLEAGGAACRCTLRSGTSLTAETRRWTTASRSWRTLRRNGPAWLALSLLLHAAECICCANFRLRCLQHRFSRSICLNRIAARLSSDTTVDQLGQSLPQGMLPAGGPDS